VPILDARSLPAGEDASPACQAVCLIGASR